MTQTEFLSRLDRLISALPAEERKRAAEFYSEVILDRMENGKSEEEAVAAFGPVEEVAAKVMAEYTPLRQPSLFLKIMKIIALIFGIPIMLCIVIPLSAVAFVLYACLWILMASLFIIVLSFGLVGIVGVVGTIFVLPQSIPAGVFQLGAGLLFSGLCIFTLIGSFKLLQLLLRFTVWLAEVIRNSFRRRKWIA